jgi:hypothetical protein
MRYHDVYSTDREKVPPWGPLEGYLDAHRAGSIMPLSVAIAARYIHAPPCARSVICSTPLKHERKFITLLARLDASNCSFLDLRVFPNIDRRKRFQISLCDAWLNRGKLLSDLSRLREVVASVRLARRTQSRESDQFGLSD